MPYMQLSGSIVFYEAYNPKTYKKVYVTPNAGLQNAKFFYILGANLKKYCPENRRPPSQVEQHNNVNS